MAVVETGANYACLPKEKFKYGVKKRATGNGNDVGTLELDNIVNTGAHLQKT